MSWFPLMAETRRPQKPANRFCRIPGFECTFSPHAWGGPEILIGPCDNAVATFTSISSMMICFRPLTLPTLSKHLSGGPTR